MKTNIGLVRIMDAGTHITTTLFFLLMTVSLSESAPSFKHNHLFEKPRILTGSTSSAYNFPFFCTVHAVLKPNVENITISSCTILNACCVLFSPEIFDRLLSHYGKLPVSYEAGFLYVYAGADSLEPNEPVSGNIQKRYVQKVALGLRPQIKRNDLHPDFKYVVNPTGPMNDSRFIRNALGELYSDIGILELKTTLDWSPYVLPAPIISDDVFVVRRVLRDLFRQSNHHGNCVIAGWGPLGNNQLMTHKLIHVPFDDCREAICGQYPETCLEYPIEFYHVCFKSNTYGDVCSYDQGAPVYCSWFQKTVFALLAKAFDCGLTSLPAVYTLIDFAADIQYHFKGGRKPLQERINYNDYRVGKTARPVTPNFNN